MKKANPFLLESLQYQTDAVEAVVGVFEGTSSLAAHEFAGNRCTLLWSQIRSNLQSIAQRHRTEAENPQVTTDYVGTTVHGRMVHVQPQRLFAAPRDTYAHFKQADVNAAAPI